jgi:hypothetical protein
MNSAGTFGSRIHTQETFGQFKKSKIYCSIMQMQEVVAGELLLKKALSAFEVSTLICIAFENA